MRLTIEIDDDVVAAARKIAERSDRSVDAVISEFARNGSTQEAHVVIRNGIPLIKRPGGQTITSELVHRLMEEDDLPLQRDGETR